MRRISFTPNQQVRLFGKVCTVESIVNDQVTLRSDTGARRCLSFHTLLQHHSAGNLKATGKPAKFANQPRPEQRRTGALLADLSTQCGEATKRRNQLLKAIGDDVSLRGKDAGLISFVEEAARLAGFSSTPSFKTLREWRHRLQMAGGDPMGLAPRFDRRGGRGKQRFSPEVLTEMDTVIDNFYLTPTALSALDVHTTLVARLHEKNQWRGRSEQLAIPSYWTFRRRIQSREAYEVMAARHGERTAQLTFRNKGVNIEAYRFNECWEVDHTMMDVIVVDPVTKEIIARPWITVMIEFTTRAVMGFHIGLGAASAQSVLSCLKHAIRPKLYLKEKYPDVQGEWPCFGLPLLIKCDNGREFHARNTLDAAGNELGIGFRYCPVKKPWFKARIERFFGTLNTGLLNQLPGATGNSPKNRKDVGPAHLPVLDLEMLKRLVHIWIVDVYMTSSHRGIK